MDAMSVIEHDGDGDTIYAIDRISEELLVEFFSREVAPITPIVLIAEGIAAAGQRTQQLATDRPNRGDGTNLQDIQLAVQTEIPLVKQHLSDTLWAIKGHGAKAERFNRVNGHRSPLPLQPSRAATIAHGFAMLSRFFPGARDVIAAIDEDLGLPADFYRDAVVHAREIRDRFTFLDLAADSGLFEAGLAP